MTQEKKTTSENNLRPRTPEQKMLLERALKSMVANARMRKATNSQQKKEE